MSKLSIYEDPWINLVFEGKNKEYGAYQLRHESDRTMLHAFLMSLLLVSGVAGIYLIVSYFNPASVAQMGELENTAVIIQVTPFHPIEPEKPLKKAIPISEKTADIKKERLSNPEIVKPIDATDPISTNETHFSNTQNTNENSTVVGTNTIQVPVIGIPAVSDAETKVNTTNVLDKLPEFPGGIAKFYSYVGNNFEKPEFDIAKTVKIYVAFVIEKDGSMTDIKVGRDPGYGLGQEAIRVLKSLKTKWTPGMMNGKAVRTAYNLPIVVEIK
jgi:protein TonB